MYLYIPGIDFSPVMHVYLRPAYQEFYSKLKEFNGAALFKQKWYGTRIFFNNEWEMILMTLWLKDNLHVHHSINLRGKHER
jgi:hypothetical protein